MEIQLAYKEKVLKQCSSKYKIYICECMNSILDKEQNVYYTSYPGEKLQTFYEKIDSNIPISRDDIYYKITFEGMIEACRRDKK